MNTADSRPSNPFPGLRPFRSDEHHLFFGREEQTAALLELLRTNRFLAVVGTSGSGKSSLVRAGLIAALYGGTMTQAGSAWEVIILRPGGSPIENLARAFVEAGLYDADDPGTLPRLLATLNRSRFGLVEAMKQSDVFEPGMNLLVVVDQFEELFRFRQQGIDSEETAAAFVNLLLTASQRSECPIYVTITMRSDYLGDCSEIPGLAEAVNDGEYLIPRLLRDQKRDAIEKPIGVGGAKITPLLVQRLLNEVGDDPDQLPVLQHALMRMWEAWSAGGNAERAIDRDDFEATGGLASALSNHADEIYDALPDDRHRSVCEKVFKALTQKGEDNRGIRRPTRLSQLQAIADSDRATVTTVLDAFRGVGVTFLMPGPEIELADRTVLDLSHESLMRGWQRLRGWVDEEAQSARIFRRLLDTAKLWSDGKAGLFRDPDLQIAISWRQQQAPNGEWAEEYGGNFETAINFLQNSSAAAEAEGQARESARQRELQQARELAEAQQLRLEHQQRASRKLQKMIAGLAVFAVIAGVACVAALLAHERSKQNEQIAQRNEEKATQSAKLAMQSQQEADQARAASEKSREAAQAEAYRAVLSGARALRAGRAPGWRDDALTDLARLSNWPYAKRDMLELRTEAVAALGTPDVQLFAQTERSLSAIAIAPMPDGQTLVTVDGRSSLDFWNVRDGKYEATSEPLAEKLPASIWYRNKAVCLPGGQGFAVATRDHGILFTDLSGKRTSRPPITNGSFPPGQVSVDAEGRRLAVAWMGGGIGVYDLADGKTLAQIPGAACAISPDGKWIAHHGSHYEVLLYPIDSAEPEKTVGHHDGFIARLAFSADGKRLASGSEDHTAILWDVSGRAQPVVLRGHRDTVNDIAFSPDGGWVATVSTDFTARIWDSTTGQSLAMLPSPSFLIDAAWMADGAVLAINSGNQVSLYRVTGRQVFQRLALHRHGVQCVVAHPGLDRFASGADDHRTIEWSLATTQPSARWNEEDSQFVTAAAYSPDGSLLATGTGYGAIAVHDTETGAIRSQFTPPGKDGIQGLAFDPAGKRLASGGRKGNVIIWDVATSQALQRLQVGSGYVWSIAFLDEGNKLLVMAWQGPLTLFDLATGKPERQFIVPGGGRKFALDRARNRLIIAGSTGDLVTVSLSDFTERFRLEHAHPGSIESLALSADGRLLATGGADRRVVLRDPETFAALLAFPEWTGNIRDLAFTLSGQHLAYVGADSDVALWDLARLREGLQRVGLAWNQSAPPATPASSPASDGATTRPAGPIILRGGGVDIAEYAQATQLLSTGVQAYRAGVLANAIGDLQKARDLLRSAQKKAPGNSGIASRLSISLAFLGSALKDDGRLAEAVAARKEARDVLEGMRDLAPVDYYNLACVYASLSVLHEPGSAPPTEDERQALIEKALAALGRSFASGRINLELVAHDPTLDPLRDRPQFQVLVLESSGRRKEAVALLDKLSAARPEDALLPIKVSALQAWYGLDEERAATCRRVLELAKDTKDPVIAERISKACNLHASVPEIHEAALVLARRAVELGQTHQYRCYFYMALGMAEYRSGHFAEAEPALLSAVKLADPDNLHVKVASAYYRAMSLFRQGKVEEARQVAVAAAAKMPPVPVDEMNAVGSQTNHDDVIDWLTYKEAKALIQFSAPPPEGDMDEE